MAAIKTETDAKQFFQQYFPMFIPFIRPDEFARFAAKGDSRFQKFQYVEKQLHHGRSTVLVGDCAHTVKPYFGLGVNSAFEDVATLEHALDEHPAAYDRQKALEAYSKQRIPEAAALVQLSQRFDRSTVEFVLPLILDGFFHKLAPQLFERSALSMMQDERNSFTYVARRKRRDRVLQLLFLGTAAVGAAGLARTVLGAAVRLVKARMLI